MGRAPAAGPPSHRADRAKELALHVGPFELLAQGERRAGPSAEFWAMGYFFGRATNTVKKGTYFYPFHKHFFIEFCMV